MLGISYYTYYEMKTQTFLRLQENVFQIVPLVRYCYIHYVQSNIGQHLLSASQRSIVGGMVLTLKGHLSTKVVI